MFRILEYLMINKGYEDFRIWIIDDIYGLYIIVLMDLYVYISSIVLILIWNFICKGCFKYINEYVIKNLDICDNLIELVFLIVFVVDGFD